MSFAFVTFVDAGHERIGAGGDLVAAGGWIAPVVAAGTWSVVTASIAPLAATTYVKT